MNTAENAKSPGQIDRRAPRERAFLKACISFANGSISYSCLVTQISAKGVKVSVDSHAPMPDRLNISIPQRGIDGPARLVWRRGDSAALAFLEAGESETAALEILQQRVRTLEAENTNLRATVASLLAQLKQTEVGY